ncbi:UDP-glucosyltransferase 2-like isoform X2 [Leptidea sinapis]|uniref:UDP-glucosyltransferase 2-like isoform X2 n=1 Tax=Leptidea sinapis TaxID=189913 RepID=UPI0021C28F50|nr:UDP-glucosyltransferase 2-like isoform X2 [Leptidea sinapis]
MALTTKFLLLVISLLCSVDAYKILVVISLPGRSHGILGEGLVRHLTNAGHEVTYITPFPPKNPPNNTKVIDVSDNNKTFKGDLLNLQNMMSKRADINSMYVMIDVCLEVLRSTVANHNVQNMLRDPTQKFDVVISEWLYAELYAGFAAVYDCPNIWFSSLEPHWMVLRLIDEMPNPAYVPDSLSSKSPPLAFMERVEELYNSIRGRFDAYYMSFWEDNYYKKYLVPYIKNKPVPTFEELKYNASLMLGNSHISLGEAYSLPQSYKPIGGYHIETDVRPLPKDLKVIMDNSLHGVIYFSMGSNLRSEHFPEKLTRRFLDIFAELKQTVIWKFEANLSDIPKNVHIVDWAPQQSILAHPNCLFFISHGGLLSTTESIHFGVPMIGIPGMVDQYMNVDRAVRRGFAIRVDLAYDMDKDLKKAINEMLNESKYRKIAKELSFIYHDRPVSPGAELVHWVEHVVKTRGALHLQSPALNVPFYQKLYLDLLALIIAFVLTVIYIAYRIFFSRSVAEIQEKKRR